MPTHKTLSGHVIEYDTPEREVVEFIVTLARMASDPAVTENDITAVAYGRANPFLEPIDAFPGRGAVTRETLATNPYKVMADLLLRKHLQQTGREPETLAARYTMTVAEAAKSLGISRNAVLQAIAAQRLASWMRDGRHWLKQQDVEAFAQALAPRGPAPTDDRRERAAEGTKAGLQLQMGSTENVSLRVAADVLPIEKRRMGAFTLATLPGQWTRAAVVIATANGQRCWLLQPASTRNELAHGPFFVRGRFSVDRVEDERPAAEQWRSALRDGLKKVYG